MRSRRIGETAFQIFASGLLLFLLALCAVSVVVLIADAVWMYGDAQRRGMDAAVWLILLIVATIVGTVIGFVIVLVIYLVVRENHPIGGGFPIAYGPYPPLPTSGGTGRVPRVRQPDDVVPSISEVVLSCLRTIPVRSSKGRKASGKVRTVSGG